MSASRSQLGRRNLPDDQRAALALSVGDRRTALSLSERAQKAGAARVASAVRDENGKMVASLVADGDHQAGEPAIEKAKKPRIRAQVAKQASVSEKRIRAVAEIRKADPDAYRRILSGQSTPRGEGGAEQGAPGKIKAKPRRRSMVPTAR